MKKAPLTTKNQPYNVKLPPFGHPKEVLDFVQELDSKIETSTRRQVRQKRSIRETEERMKSLPNSSIIWVV